MDSGDTIITRKRRNRSDYKDCLNQREQSSRLRKLREILEKNADDRNEEERQILEESSGLIPLVESKLKKALVLRERNEEKEDPPEILREKCLALAQIIKSCHNLIIYSGAGISTSAKIPDYRGPNGENENAGKKPELDLTVRDWKGRRRFHGAFTGGFSAGYFNTVGTEKGWMPSQYISKREDSSSHGNSRSRPEDFMDEEDFSVFGIAPKKVHTREQFKGPESQAFAGFRDPKASIIDVLKDIIKPCTRSIGVELFKAMKIGRRYKGAIVENKTVKVYGCEMPAEVAASRGYSHPADSSDVLDEFDLNSLVLPYKPKSDLHGIGYKSLQSIVSDENSKSAPLTAMLSGNKKLKISGEAFGYGALEDEDDDPLIEESQIYANDDMSNYDFELGYTRKNTLPITSGTSKSISSQSKEVEGFSRVDMIKPLKSSETLPSIPRNWKPSPPFLSENKKKRSRWDKSSSTQPSNVSKNDPVSSSIQRDPPKELRPPALNANSRAVLLGEEIDVVMAVKKKENLEPSAISPPEPEIPRLLKPLTGFFACKFVRSDEVIEDKIAPGLCKVAFPAEQEVKVEKREEKSSVGQIKRETFQWHPHTLLCKRFEVSHPYPQFSEVVGLIVPAGESKSISGSERSSAFLSAGKKSSEVPLLIPVPQKRFNPIHEAKMEETRVEKEIEEDEKYVKLEDRESMDLFRAIFASDEEEDEEEDEKDQPEEKATELTSNEKYRADSSSLAISSRVDEACASSSTVIDSIEPSEPIQRSVEPQVLSTPSKLLQEPYEDQNESEIKEEVDFYGPALPPQTPSPQPVKVDLPSSSHSKSNKSSKSKKKKKSNKKHKKHKRKRESSEESDDSVDLKIIKLLRSS
ncbi:G patch domain-containing protein 1 [Brevipalpus obovatus]|uniref:G patch domain-containing protein 1 n=1 Tax=Brevipalpus obovatus TaxID=246614 RepID=UPI003D9E8D7B